jgi:hypothetical protein
MSPRVDTPTLAAFRGAYEAFDWVNANLDLFPTIRDGT